jgi:serine/threonine protein kinase
MPREQVINFKYIRPVSDVWSMGATLYRLLTGRSPREGKPGQSQMEIVLGGTVVPIRRRKENIPDPLANVIDRSLARDAEERYQNATEMREALEAAL